MTFSSQRSQGAVPLRPIASKRKKRKAEARKADPADAQMICEWITAWGRDSPNVTKWLGALADRDLLSQVNEWIGSDWGSYVLEIEGGTPVAFINLHSIAGDIEVGRLVVNPEHSRQGYGSSLLLHVSRNISDEVERKATYARVLIENERAQGMFRKLPFAEVDAPLGTTEAAANFFKFVGRTESNTFGEKLSQIRRSRLLRQDHVGFLAGIGQSAVAMIESGNRLPRLETVSAICSSLNLTKGEKAQLLFALLGERLGENVKKVMDAAHSTSESAIKAKNENLWIVSDTFLEEMSDEAIALSAQSASDGFNRWYFAPPGFVETGRAKSMLKRIIDRAECRQKAEEAIRVYTAPAALCAMRFVVENPPRSLTSAVVDSRVSFGGSTESERVIISGERAKEFVIAMAKTIARLPHDGVVDGFRLEILANQQSI